MYVRSLLHNTLVNHAFLSSLSFFLGHRRVSFSWILIWYVDAKFFITSAFFLGLCDRFTSAFLRLRLAMTGVNNDIVGTSNNDGLGWDDVGDWLFDELLLTISKDLIIFKCFFLRRSLSRFSCRFWGFFLELVSIVVSSTFLFIFLHRWSTADTPCTFQRSLIHYTFHLLNLFEKDLNMRNREVSWLSKQLMLGFLEISMFLKNDKKVTQVKIFNFWLQENSLCFILEIKIRNRK